jgi:molybdenum cofactor cytidylyltransferase
LSPPEVIVVILAAGASRRLGTAKQLVLIAGESLLRRQCRCALSAKIGPVFVVLGCNAELHCQVITDLPVEVRVNADWVEGLASTLRRAVHIAVEQRSAALLLPCDQYRVSPSDLRALCDAWRADPLSPCVSRWGANAGPPIILPRECFGDVLQLRGDTGARGCLYKPQRRRPHEVNNENAAYDIDLPEDLNRLKSLEGDIRQWTTSPHVNQGSSS